MNNYISVSKFNDSVAIYVYRKNYVYSNLVISFMSPTKYLTLRKKLKNNWFIYYTTMPFTKNKNQLISKDKLRYLLSISFNKENNINFYIEHGFEEYFI